MTNLFKADISMTIGVDFQVKPVEIDGEKVKLQIWDFAGEERFRFLLPSYIQGASGGIYMYDVTNYASLAHVENWLEIIEDGIKTKEVDKNFPIVFVGSKIDLSHIRELSLNKAMGIAQSKGAAGFLECSSKTGENVEKIFNLMAKLIITDKK